MWDWAAGGAAGYDAMSNLPGALREELARAVPFSTLTVETQQESKDGTVKTLFKTADGHPVEAVLMRYGRTPLALPLVAVGLPADVHVLRHRADGVRPQPDGVGDPRPGAALPAPDTGRPRVFMGMGEPMLNFDEVLAAARKLPDIGITHRRTTISTVGWLPGLTRFVDEVDVPIRLALSLHAPDDELRSKIMPVNDKYPLRDILAECRRHVDRTNRRVYIEYVMLAGVNDSPEQGKALGKLLGRDHFKVNLIPYNPTGMYDGSSRDRIAAFKLALDRTRVPSTVRLTRGRDIEAACGQLATAPKARGRRAPPTA